MSWVTTVRIAWRNLGRNRRRTALALSAIGFAELTLVVLQGLISGYGDLITQSITGAVIGHVQVHAPKWREDRALDRSLRDTTALLAAVRATPGVAAVNPRIYAPTLVAKGLDGQAAVVVGVDLALEGEHGLLEGLAVPPLGRNEVVLGELLAQRLDARVGDELALVGQAIDGSVASELYRVRAVVSTQVDLVNRLGLVMPLADARELLAMPDGAHELFVIGTQPQGADALAATLAATPALAGLEVLSWKQLAPEFAVVVDFVGAYQVFLLLLVFVAAAAGAANTMMMATFERTRELGMLLGLGAQPRRIVTLVVVEGLLLGLLALTLGAAAGLAIVLVTHDTGINLSRLVSGASENIAFMGMKWTMVMYPRVPLLGLAQSAVAVFLTSLLAALWPAIRAARLEPVEAMRS
ncbi:MAG: ABC transporter permease [Myxococcota bacterium]